MAKVSLRHLPLLRSYNMCGTSGTSLLFTSKRLSTLLPASHQLFPPIPESAESFISSGVNQRPTFFGCDPNTPADFPLVIYLPNSPPLTGDNPTTKYVFPLIYQDITFHHHHPIFQSKHVQIGLHWKGEPSFS
jgi:hypothetical protein